MSFDETHIDGSHALARSGDGIAMLIGSAVLDAGDRGSDSGRRTAPGGPQGALDRPSFRHAAGRRSRRDAQTFPARYRSIEEPGGILTVVDPDYGRIVFEEDGTVHAEGRTSVRPNGRSKGKRRILKYRGRGNRRLAS